MITPYEVNYFFHDAPGHVLANAHVFFIFEAIICWMTLVYLQKKISQHYLQVTNAFASLMTKLHI